MRVQILRRQFPRQWRLKQTIFARSGDGLFGLAGAGHVDAVTLPRRLLHDAAHAIFKKNYVLIWHTTQRKLF